MNSGSIRLRLWSAAAISIVVALAIAGVGLRFLFERHVERRVETDLTVALNLIVGATTFADGTLWFRRNPPIRGSTCRSPATTGRSRISAAAR